jgi:Tol biopolymer transport system component
VWEPRGNSIAYIRDGALWRTSLDSGQAVRLTGKLGSYAYATWSPDGRMLAIAARARPADSRAHLYVLPSRGGKLRELNSVVAEQAPAWSPTGDMIAFITGDRIDLVDTNRGSSRTLVRLSGRVISELAWSPDGRRLAFASATRSRET